MEVSPLQIPGTEEHWAEHIAATLQAQRKRVREFLTVQQERLSRAETELAEQLNQIAVELADDRCQTRNAQAELSQRTGDLQHQAEVLENMKTDLAARHTEWEGLYRQVIEQQQAFADQLKQQQGEFARRQQDLLQQQTVVVSAEAHLLQERKQIETSRAELENRHNQLLALQDSLNTKQAEIEKRQQELDARSAETEIQRRRIARELKAQRADNLKILNRRQTEQEHNADSDRCKLQRQLESLQEECRILKVTTPDAANAAELQELKARNQELQQQLDNLRNNSAQSELLQHTGDLQQQAEALENMKIDLAARHAEWEKLYRQVIEQQQAFADQQKQQQGEFARRQQDLLQQQTVVVSAEAHLLHEKKQIETSRAELENRHNQLLALQDSLNTKKAEIEKRQQEVDARSAETDIQRRRIARELKAQRADNLKIRNRRQTKQEQNADSDRSQLQRQLESLQEECRILKATPLDAANAAELQELKTSNQELQQQLTNLRNNSVGIAGKISSSILNWEAEKQRILTALEHDFDEESEEDREHTLKIKNVIHKTDKLVAEKDCEIGELKKLLESQTDNIGSMAVGAKALGQILDTDAVIKEERDNLAQLQEEWREKLRHAEIEISLERAKIAREQSQLDEKLRALEKQSANSKTSVDENKPAKPARGRWLAQLGLTNSENEH